MEKGKYVSRAVYARIQAENHRLRKDLRTICMGSQADRFEVRARWRKEFQHEEAINKAISKAALEYFKEHPELKINYPRINNL